MSNKSEAGWQDRVQTIADEALGIGDEEERRAYVHGRCEHDERLARAVLAETIRRATIVSQLTRLLNRAPNDPEVRDRLAEYLLPELRRIAHARLRLEPRDPEVETGVLADDAFMKVLGPVARTWESRRHFWGAVANAVRELCIDYARRRDAAKRGGDVAHVPLDGVVHLLSRNPEEPPAIADAITMMEREYRREAEAIDLHYFAQRSREEIAQMLGVSMSTVRNELRFARTWLRHHLAAR